MEDIAEKNGKEVVILGIDQQDISGSCDPSRNFFPYPTILEHVKLNKEFDR